MKTTRKIGNQEYEVKYNDDNIFYLPHKAEDRRRVLSNFVKRECNKLWRREDQKVATMKREFLQELLDSL